MLRSIGINVFHFVLLAVVVHTVQSEGAQDNNGCIQFDDVGCPDNKHIHFVLYSSSNQSEILDVGADNISSSNFDSENPTKIIIHGFMGNSSDKHYDDMRLEYLSKGKYNVIMVDWSDLARGPKQCFPKAYAKSKHVGECTKGLIQLLRDTHAMTDEHVIGHDLGVSVLISAARGLDPKLPRFTALDPSRSSAYGSSVAVTPPTKSDADFVDVIHTSYQANTGNRGLGYVNPAGHVDFYANKAAMQPGCAKTSEDRDGSMCSHLRSVLLYTESINSETGFYGNQCTMSKVRKSQCTKDSLTVLMGDGVLTTTTGVVAVPTNDQSPYAQGKKD